MIRFVDVGLRRGPERLIEGLDVQISPGWRVGVTGRNGCGKSSLFALLRGELLPDAGHIERPPQWVVAHLAQDVTPSAQRAIDFVVDGDRELRRLHTELEQAMAQQDGLAAARLTAAIDAIDGWSAEARAGRLLDGLGFRPEDARRPVSDFSGGWRMRLGLAQTLMTRADLLLLDEPTNHLDVEAVQWLADHLCQQPATVLVVAHDRHFLDRVCTHTLHIEHRRGVFRRGGYSDAERARAERLAQDEALRARLAEERAHLEAFVRRFRAKASKARQAQSRLKRLAKLDDVVLLRAARPKPIPVHNPEHLPNPLLTLERARIDSDDPARPRLVGATLRLRPDDRIGILGQNGAGKSTLLGALAGTLALADGVRQLAAGVRVGHFAQHQHEQLDDADTPLAHLQRLDPDAREQTLRDRLGHFGFSGPQMDNPIRGLSGGERVRLVLAGLFAHSPGVLLLDEPTNHLDLEMREVLADALERFTGALVVVAHDRSLLERVCDRLWRVEGGYVAEYPGDLDDYLAERGRTVPNAPTPFDTRADVAWLGARPRQQDVGGSVPPALAPPGGLSAPTAAAPAAALGGSRPEPTPSPPSQHALTGGQLHAARKAATREEAQAERALDAIAREIRTIDDALGDPALYTDAARHDEIERLSARRATLIAQRDAAEQRLLDAMAAREALDAQASTDTPRGADAR